jgi:hypothetical protein
VKISSKSLMVLNAEGNLMSNAKKGGNSHEIITD